jgi:hypothetical protein
MNNSVEYIPQDNNVLVVHNDQLDENGYPLVVEISYEEYFKLIENN